MDDRDTARFLEAIKGCRYELLLKVDLFTGLREGELLGLMWDCVDFDKGTILVNKQLHRSQKKGRGLLFFSAQKQQEQDDPPCALCDDFAAAAKARTDTDALGRWPCMAGKRTGVHQRIWPLYLPAGGI